MILTNGASLGEDMVDLAKENKVTVISTEFNSFMTSRLLPLTIPVSQVMTTENLIYFKTDDPLDLVKDMMAKSRFRSYPVVDAKKKSCRLYF